MYSYTGKLVYVVDADTFDIEVDLGFGIYTKQRFRLLGGDAYETRLGRGTSEEDKEKGLEAKGYLTELSKEYGSNVQLISSKTGKYGRYLCDLFFKDHDGNHTINLLEALRGKGYLKC